MGMSEYGVENPFAGSLLGVDAVDFNAEPSDSVVEWSDEIGACVNS